MGVPSGKIVARPMVKRACGHEQEFQHYEVDKYRQQRLAKFQQSRCADCVAKLQEEQKRLAQSIPRKGEALQALPPGVQVSMSRKADGGWQGTLAAEGVTVEETSDGAQALIVALARRWLLVRKPNAAAGVGPAK